MIVCENNVNGKEGVMEECSVLDIWFLELRNSVSKIFYNGLIKQKCNPVIVLWVVIKLDGVIMIES